MEKNKRLIWLKAAALAVPCTFVLASPPAKANDTDCDWCTDDECRVWCCKYQCYDGDCLREAYESWKECLGSDPTPSLEEQCNAEYREAEASCASEDCLIACEDC